jgi:predicted PurR-regulated permease PerM
LNYKFKKYNNLINCSILLIVFILLTYIIKNYFEPFTIIVLLIFSSNPIYKLLCRIKFLNKRISALISLLLLNTLFIIFTYMTANFLIIQIQIFLNNDSKNIITLFQNLLRRVNLLNYINLNVVNEKLNTLYSNLINSEFIKKGAVNTTEGIMSYFIGNIAAYFILIDKYVILDWIKILVPNIDFSSLNLKIRTINKMFQIELSLVLLTTLETIFGFFILHIKDFLILGIICGMLDILPYVGTIIVFLPLVLYGFMLRDYFTAIGLILLYLLIQINRQYMETKFMSNKLKIHPLFILIAIYIGAKLFGVIGLFMGLIYIIVAKEVIEEN